MPARNRAACALTLAFVVAVGGRVALAEPVSATAPETGQPPRAAAPPPTSWTQSFPPRSPDPGWARAPQEEWYGWQILLTAGGSHLLLWGPLLFAQNGSDPYRTPLVPIFGLGGLALGGPVVHWAHGSVGKGFGSFGLNVGMPLGLGGAGALLCTGSRCGRGEFAPLVGFVFGALIGSIAATTIDVAVLAYEPVADGPTVSRTTKPRLSLVPDIMVTRDGNPFVTFSGVF